MKIINTRNPAHGCADFALLCDYCGGVIGDEPANIEFSNLGEAYCLHKGCSDAFRHKLGEKLFWVGLEEFKLTTSEALTKCNINLIKGTKTNGTI